MSSQYVAAHQNVREYIDNHVFRYRVAVHTLGRQYVNRKSENHLSIYLLLGADRSFHLDMKPTDDETKPFVGKVILQGRPFLQSSTVLEWADLAARGCPANFNPSRRQEPTAGSPTVRDFILACTTARFHYFRFLCHEDNPVGCRTWV